MAFSVSYSAGGILDTIGTIGFIEGMHGFAQYLLPYNVMEYKDVPPTAGVHTLEVVLPDKPMELLAFSVSSTGYGEKDWYDLYINEHKAFEHWYLQEVKEGLFIGSSTFVYRLPPRSQIRLDFNNVSATRKILYLGVRTLVPSAEQLAEMELNN